MCTVSHASQKRTAMYCTHMYIDSIRLTETKPACVTQQPITHVTKQSHTNRGDR